MTRVGFIGAGQMGMPMVERIQAAGFEVSVYARRPEVRQVLSGLGVGLAASARHAAEGSDVVCVCTFDDAQLREVVFGPDGRGGALAALAPGAVLVNHTTGSPALAREMADAAPLGTGLVDAPVSGSADQIRAGQLTVLVGASEEHLAAARPVLETYASTILPVGGVGDAQSMKLLNNLVFTVHVRVAALATELAGRLGVAPADMGRALAVCSGTSLPISLLATMPLAGLTEGARPFLRKDVAVIRRVAADLGVDLGPLDEIASWVDA